MSEGARLTIWMIIVILDIYIFIDYVWHKAGKEVRYVKSRKSRKKNRNTARNKGRGDHLTLIWNDMDRIHGDYRKNAQDHVR